MTYEDNKDYNTWNETLEVIKKNAPPGLYERWKFFKPVGLLQWRGGMDTLENVDNSYNWINMNEDSNNIVFQAGKVGSLIAVAFHIEGDARANYTDYFLFSDDLEDLPLFPFEKDEWLQMGGEVEE
jgi:hypothetical protein